eukprot:Tamp_22329.p2 GENE.Tamp_22329~~Tamp_22329.p2  ORF type:complete len:147 (-),score=3.45 Tamp_22329:585-1025(-)
MNGLWELGTNERGSRPSISAAAALRSGGDTTRSEMAYVAMPPEGASREPSITADTGAGAIAKIFNEPTLVPTGAHPHTSTWQVGTYFYSPAACLHARLGCGEASAAFYEVRRPDKCECSRALMSCNGRIKERPQHGIVHPTAINGS